MMISRVLQESLVSLFCVKNALESRGKRGDLDWASSQRLNASIKAIEEAYSMLLLEIPIVKGISDSAGYGLGGLLKLTEKGKIAFRPVLGDEVDEVFTVIQLKPLNLISLSGIRIHPVKSYVTLD